MFDTMVMDSDIVPGAFCSKALRGNYQRPDSTLTLRAAVKEYMTVNPGLFELNPDDNEHAASYYLRHDYCHVIFGTDTSLLNESITDSWILFGVNVGMIEYSIGFFKTDESKEIWRQIGTVRRGLFLFWKSMQLMPMMWKRTRQMKKKWPWNPPKSYLDRPLNELRAEYGIVPVSIQEQGV